MTVKELHRKAMTFVDSAIMAKQKKESDSVVVDYYKQAFEFEKKAYLLYIKKSDKEPTKTILLKSLVNLSITVGEYVYAEQLIKENLKKELPIKVANELEEVLVVVKRKKLEEALSELELKLVEYRPEVSFRELHKSITFTGLIPLIDELNSNNDNKEWGLIRNSPYESLGVKRITSKNISGLYKKDFTHQGSTYDFIVFWNTGIKSFYILDSNIDLLPFTDFKRELPHSFNFFETQLFDDNNKLPVIYTNQNFPLINKEFEIQGTINNADLESNKATIITSKKVKLDLVIQKNFILFVQNYFGKEVKISIQRENNIFYLKNIVSIISNEKKLLK